MPVSITATCEGGMEHLSMLYKSNPAALVEPSLGTIASGYFRTIFSLGGNVLDFVSSDLRPNSMRILAPGGLSSREKCASSNLAYVVVLIHFVSVSR